MAVMPSSRQIRWINSRTRIAVAGSRLATGSSARMVLGAWISARAMPTRCCWPPESSSARLSARSRSSTRSRTSSARRALGSTWRQQRPQRRVEPKPAEQDVLQRRMPADQMVLLEDHGRLPAVTAQRPCADEDRLVIASGNGTTRGSDQPVQTSQQRGFAGSGGAQQYDKSAEFKAEADAVQCADGIRIDDGTLFDPEHKVAS
jgi:hypothetical protein